MQAATQTNHFGKSSSFTTTTSEISAEERILYKGSNIQVLVPEKHLARGSIDIEAIRTGAFDCWSYDDHLGAFHSMKAIARCWSGMDYLFYGKIDRETPFKFEAVPFPKTFWFLKYVNQILVLARIRFGGFVDRVFDRANLDASNDLGSLIGNNVKSSAKKHTDDPVDEEEDKKSKTCDVFCNKERCQRQFVYEGKHSNVFYNIKQIGKEKLDFLIVPKRHVEKFDELMEEEGIEMTMMAQKIYNYLQSKPTLLGLPEAKAEYKVHMFIKTGKGAGQTVDHLHWQYLVEKKTTPESRTFWAIIRNMIWARTLPDREIRETSERLLNDMREVLSARS